VAKIEWHRGELFPRICFVITNSRLPAGKVIKVYNGRAEIENRITILTWTPLWGGRPPANSLILSIFNCQPLNFNKLWFKPIVFVRFCQLRFMVFRKPSPFLSPGKIAPLGRP
jgi:hypothetical protein